MHKIDLLAKFAQFTELWQPQIVAELNGQCVELAKLQGIFVWHAHFNEDQMFLVVEGRLRLQFRDGEEVLEAGEMIVVPAGVEHRPMAEAECWVILLAPKSPGDTGSLENRDMFEPLNLL